MSDLTILCILVGALLGIIGANVYDWLRKDKD